MSPGISPELSTINFQQLINLLRPQPPIQQNPTIVNSCDAEAVFIPSDNVAEEEVDISDEEREKEKETEKEKKPHHKGPMPIKFEKKKRSRQVKLAKRAKTIRQKCQEVYANTKASVNLTITSADPHEKTKICNQWRYHTNTRRNVAQSFGQSYTSVDFNNHADDEE